MNLEIIEKPFQKDIDFLTQKINEEALDYGVAYNFAIIARTEDSKIIGGCNGSIVFGSIYTDQLWVDPHFRCRGLGKKLMEKVHDYGRKNDCLLSTVVTMTFQAPDFYKKLGYTIDFSRKGYIKNSCCIFMSKKL